MNSPLADELQECLEQSQLPWEPAVAQKVSLWRALREPDIRYLRHHEGWNRHTRHGVERSYVPDPLPGQIASAHADLLFGDEPKITAAKTSDQERLDDLCDAVDLPSELHRAEEIASSEGEVWWRIYTDREAADYPCLQWVSRLDVCPLWRAGRPVAVAFLSILDVDAAKVTRHIEIQAPGVTRNLLYTGAADKLGQQRNLDTSPDTADLPDEWAHPPLMLAGRVLNRHGITSGRLGRSDFKGAEEMMLKLNEATTIATENARSVGKKRLMVKGAYLDERGNLPAGDDVFRADPDGGELGSDTAGPVTSAEYTYEAEPLIAHQRDLIERIAIRAGLVPQWIGVMEQGQAESGTALRVRLLPATLTAHGKAKIWMDKLPGILGLLQMVDAMSEQQGGYGRQWSAAAEDPNVELGDPIPNDPMEDVTRGVALVESGLQSRETTIRELHPEWTDELVAQELARIKAEDAERQPTLTDPFGDRHDPATAAGPGAGGDPAQLAGAGAGVAA